MNTSLSWAGRWHPLCRAASTTFSKQALATAPEELQLAHVPKLLDAMRPMLNTLLGKDKAEEVVKLIRTELKDLSAG